MKHIGVLLAVAVAAVPVAAQETSLVQGFAEGFTFSAAFSTSHRTEADGSVVYARNGADGAHISAMRQGMDPCVFMSTSLHLNTASFAAPVVLLEETYDLRDV